MNIDPPTQQDILTHEIYIPAGTSFNREAGDGSFTTGETVAAVSIEAALCQRQGGWAWEYRLDVESSDIYSVSYDDIDDALRITE